jgi:ABC-type amino acid transport substrate-binding protein
MMSRFLLPTLALILQACTGIAADHGPTRSAAEVSGSAELRVLFVASTGWAYHDDDGRLTGVTVELMRRFVDHVAKERGVTLALDFVEEKDWSRFYARVRDASGGVFGLGNVTITEARREELAFSPPYVTNVAVLISHHDTPELNRPAEIARVFAGQRALAFAGTLHEARLRELAEKHWPDMPMDFTRSNDEILDAAAAGTHFGYIDAYNYYRARAQGGPLKRHSTFDDPGEQFGIIMPLDNDWQAWLAEFFEADGGLIESRWYRRMMAEHLGREVAAVLLGD